MVVFDNTVFCLTLHPDAKPPSGVARAKDRIEYLLETLRDNGETVIIPTPVLAEFLVFAGADAPDYLIKIRESSLFRIEPFDERAAIELADMELAERSKGNKRGSATQSEWQKVKFDRQIIAIAKANSASVVYSDDPGVVAHGKDCGVSVLGLADLPLPPSKQELLAFEGEKNESEKDIPIQALESGPADVRGSDNGPTADQAGTEAAEAAKAAAASATPSYQEVGMPQEASAAPVPEEETSLRKLVRLMEQCQGDTFEVLGAGAAGRLANWQRYENDQQALHRFICERLLVSRENGHLLEKRGRLSLEAIVVRELPELFGPDEIEIAKATLAGIL